MELLKIKTHQVMANYRKPMSYNFVDSYPLPPLATIKGWFHAVIGATEYIPISLSIQGKVNSVLYDLQTMIKFDRIRTPTEEITPTDGNKSYEVDSKKKVVIDSVRKTFGHSPTYVANMFEVDLTLYLLSDKEHLKEFKNNLFAGEYPHIGRNEDLARIDFIDFVSVKEKNFGVRSKHEIDYGIYLNRTTAKKVGLSGSNFRMPFKYEVKDGIRYFNRKDIVYLDNAIVNAGAWLFDEDENRMIDLAGDYDKP